MSLSSTEQKFKGGEIKLVVRDGRAVLMTLPATMTMKNLALRMVQEGNANGESEYPALVRKYAALRDEMLSGGAAPAPEVVEQLSVENGGYAIDKQPNIFYKDEAFVGEAVAELPTPNADGVVSKALVTAADMLRNFIPSRPRPHQSEPLAPWQIPDEGKEEQSEKQVLADLLEAARQAEIALAGVREQYHHISVELAEKKDCAEAAWKAFNEALRASLPGDTNVFGVSLNVLPWNFNTKAGTE